MSNQTLSSSAYALLRLNTTIGGRRWGREGKMKQRIDRTTQPNECSTFVSWAKICWLVGIAGIGLGTSVAHADTILDPLHGWCNDVTPTSCTDLGANTPLGNATVFGFTISPGPQTGDLFLDILLPNNYAPPTSFTITETNGGATNTDTANDVTATLFSTTPWTSGQLDTYLGINASPTNPIGAYLPNTQVLDPAATGFYVYQFDFGTTRISDNPGAANGASYSFNPATAFDGFLGAYIVGFCGTGCTDPVVATANSGALLNNEDKVPPEFIIPEPGTLLLISVALFGLAGTALRRRRQ
jgi:hypothetical protein